MMQKPTLHQPLVLCVSLGLLVLLNGCRRPENPPRSSDVKRAAPRVHAAKAGKIELTGGGRIDVGRIPFGIGVSKEVSLRNTSTSPISPEARSSCGISTMEKCPVLAPGASYSLTISVSADREPGAFVGSVDFHLDGSVDTTLWIVGEIDASYRAHFQLLQVESQTVRVGDTFELRWALEVLCNTSNVIEHHVEVGASDQEGLTWSSQNISEYEILDSHSSGATRKIKGVLPITARQVGKHVVPIRASVKGANSKLLALARDWLSIRVVGDVWTENDVVFLGRVKVKASTGFSLFVNAPAGASPDVVNCPKTIEVGERRQTSQGKVELKFTAFPAIPGVFRETLKIGAGKSGEYAEVLVVGFAEN